MIIHGIIFVAPCFCVTEYQFYAHFTATYNVNRGNKIYEIKYCVSHYCLKGSLLYVITVIYKGNFLKSDGCIQWLTAYFYVHR